MPHYGETSASDIGCNSQKTLVCGLLAIPRVNAVKFQYSEKWFNLICDRSAGLFEYDPWEIERYHPVGHVDNFADAQVAANRAQHIGIDSSQLMAR